ncbi:MAG: hypothetical protein ACO3JG_13690, partial [Luteolibacter sp.]
MMNPSTDSAISRPHDPPAPLRPFAPWNLIPMSVGIGSLILMLVPTFLHGGEFLEWLGASGFGASVLYFLVQCAARLWKKRWKEAFWAFLRIASLLMLLVVASAMLFTYSFFGPSEDHFADRLTIPSNIEIGEPEADRPAASDSPGTVDAFQSAIRAALAVPGEGDPAIVPAMPSLRRASADHAGDLLAYLEASPDWHVFMERGNRFAARRWSCDGEPRDTLHGYISEFGEDNGFQTRCLICIDRKPWSRYRVRHVKEGNEPAKLEIETGNNLRQSRVMIECGGVWVEIFEQSGNAERRITKATIEALEKEFSGFVVNPSEAVADARGRARDLARRLAGNDGQPFRLLEGMQPGIYGVHYSLNPGEPGVVYLKASELTKGTRLSEDRLRQASATRMTWSNNPAERFGAKAGFTIYEGDWGKPYAARFEVWFKPDTGKPERKLA